MCRIFLCLLLCVVAAHVAAAQVIAGPPQFIEVLPGGDAKLTLNIRISGASDNHRLEFTTPVNSGYADYAFSTQDGRCGHPRWELTPDLQSAVLVIELQPGIELTRQCIYDVHRSVDSQKDLPLPLNLTIQRAYFGYVPKPTLTQQLVSLGADGSRIFRLSVQNPSPVALSAVPVRTGCLEYNGGVFAVPNHVFNFDFPGACTSRGMFGCPNFGGQSSTSYLFQFDSVAANGSASCLVKLVPRAGQAISVSNIAIGYRQGWGASQVPLANGGLAYLQETVPIELSSQAILTHVPSMNYLGNLVLAALVLWFGMARK